MFNPFSYLSSRIRNAVIRGFGEGLGSHRGFRAGRSAGSDQHRGSEGPHCRSGAARQADRPGDRRGRKEGPEDGLKRRRPGHLNHAPAAI